MAACWNVRFLKSFFFFLRALWVTKDKRARSTSRGIHKRVNSILRRSCHHSKARTSSISKGKHKSENSNRRLKNENNFRFSRPGRFWGFRIPQDFVETVDPWCNGAHPILGTPRCNALNCHNSHSCLWNQLDTASSEQVFMDSFLDPISAKFCMLPSDSWSGAQHKTTQHHFLNNPSSETDSQLLTRTSHWRFPTTNAKIWWFSDWFLIGNILSPSLSGKDRHLFRKGVRPRCNLGLG
jgi:hypothetical protein